MVTLFLCAPEYLSHLQQSLRRAKADRGFYFSDMISGSLRKIIYEVSSNSFELYEKMQENNIPGEDARFILPLNTKTNIQTGGDARELCHLLNMTKNRGVPLIVRKIVREMIDQAETKAPHLFEDFGFNYETISFRPAPILFANENQAMKKLIDKNLTRFNNGRRVVLISYDDKLKALFTRKTMDRAILEKKEAEINMLKHVHFTFLFPISIAGFHQVTRQRTWNLNVESIYDAASDNVMKRIVIPSSISKSNFHDAFIEQHSRMMEIPKADDYSELIGFVPHSLGVYVLAHIDGWNAIHSIGKRTCIKAQWEIRKIAWDMAKIIKKEFPDLGDWVEPQCVVYDGNCPETGDCEYYKKKKK
ncbi:FAD-dependent thymidylate synthase [Patescibacteria group bacterium]|nr:FAD-dependent thymidylate synthase [Patescibacteria group bacterium]